MSVVGFDVHMDKENATPAPHISKGGGLASHGTKDNGKLLQPTPRKALFDVNNTTSNAIPNRGLSMQENVSAKNVPRDTLLKPGKLSMVVPCGTECGPADSHSKKMDLKKAPSGQKKGLKMSKDTEHQSSKSKPLKVKKKPPPPKPSSVQEVNEEEYDSDTIFPRNERLSSYVDKLLAWRPPCLFGTIPDSESDDSEPEDLTQDNFILEMPVTLPPVPEFSDADLENLLGELPPPEPEEAEVFQAPEVDLSLNTTLDTSLSLGSLHVMHGSFDISTLQASDNQSLTES